MKKTYLTPNASHVRFDSADIITVSGAAQDISELISNGTASEAGAQMQTASLSYNDIFEIN